jgi:hypothetical protein
MDTAREGHDAAKEDSIPSSCDNKSVPRFSVCVTPAAAEDEEDAAADTEEEKDCESIIHVFGMRLCPDMASRCVGYDWRFATRRQKEAQTCSMSFTSVDSRRAESCRPKQ